MAFTDAEKVKIRHYCGFPAYGVAPLANFWMRSTYEDGQLEFVMRALSVDEEAKVITYYLPKLEQLETDIYNVRDNSDTARAAVWYRNASELQERMQNYTIWRKQLCRFIGSYYGPEIAATEITLAV
jgi:hypothetical protein